MEGTQSARFPQINGGKAWTYPSAWLCHRARHTLPPQIKSQTPPRSPKNKWTQIRRRRCYLANIKVVKPIQSIYRYPPRKKGKSKHKDTRADQAMQLICTPNKFKEGSTFTGILQGSYQAGTLSIHPNSTIASQTLPKHTGSPDMHQKCGRKLPYNCNELHPVSHFRRKSKSNVRHL